MTAPSYPQVQDARQKSKKRQLATRKFISHALLVVGALVMLYPLLWMISASVKFADQIFSDPGLWPERFRLENYGDGWFAIPRVSFGTFITNSFIVAGASVVGNVITCSMTAFAFARLEFRFKRVWFALMLVTIMLPFHVTVVPQYILFQKLGWVNTYLPLIAPAFLAADAFFIFLLVQFFRGIPRDLDEAAILDGCSYFGIFWRIILPLSVPALATTAIFTFIWTWNDFFSQLIYLNDVTKYTVPLGLRLFLDSSGQSAWGPMFAMSLLAIAPTFLFFLFAQRYFVDGIATTGLK
jgi:multiple sugar transport system permease protein